uniref:Uncharacterized protein n=1 Tax=Pararge aegeria TaxID=116150 RepID=S4P089_9NEOP
MGCVFTCWLLLEGRASTRRGEGLELLARTISRPSCSRSPVPVAGGGASLLCIFLKASDVFRTRHKKTSAII